MTVPCPGCKEPIAGPRLKRLGEKAGVDMIFCVGCARSWRIHLDAKGAVAASIVIPDRVADPNLILISGPGQWFEGLTVKVDLDDEARDIDPT